MTDMAACPLSPGRSGASSPAAEQEPIMLAVPKKGRLHNRIMEIIKGAGLHHVRVARLDVAKCTTQPVTLVFLPAADIAKYVGDGNVDMGITGEDIIAESLQADNLDVLMPLKMGKCKLCLQAAVGTITDPKELCGKRIVTSFPNLSAKYFSELDPTKETSIRYVTGSVEAAIGLGLGDGVVDLVETGTTMRAAGLEVVSEIMKTETVLICNKHSRDKRLVKRIHQRIKGYITATQNVMLSYNIKREALEEAVKITPGHESATVQALQEEDWVAVSALVENKGVNDIMDRLIDIGARSLVVVNISNCRFD